MTIEGFFGKYRFLSNFYLCTVKIGDLTYRSSEHAFHAMKTNSKKDKLYIRSAPTPFIAKKRGNTIKCKSNWKSIRVDMMYKVVEAKFIQNRFLSLKLLATGDALLIERNTYNDTFWGVCRGKGENWLGEILMEVRLKLRVIEENLKRRKREIETNSLQRI